MPVNVLYVSALCSKRVETKVVEAAPRSIGLQIQKYHRLLAKGLCANGARVIALSYNRAAALELDLPEREREASVEYRYIKKKKKGALRHISVAVLSFFKTLAIIRKEKISFAICDVLSLSVSLGALLACRLCGREMLGIVTDLPEMVTGSPENGGPYWWLIHHCTGYVLLTEEMDRRIGAGGKKYVVMEGHSDSEMVDIRKFPEKWPGKHCIYAGGLRREYGIHTLVEAFRLADVEGAQLHLYGDGDYVPELERLQDPSIHYHGVVPNEQVVRDEMCATLLINPRPTNEEFTKYSFPSKNMEYMSTGTPVLTTDLPGMPDEYHRYVYCFDDETVDGMARKLREVLNLPEEDLRDMGLSARDFVLREKNNVRQAERILKMMEIG